jgi:hypothetical protein
MGLKSPHLLLASSNPRQMLTNLSHILDRNACGAIQSEIDANVKLLFSLISRSLTPTRFGRC